MLRPLVGLRAPLAPPATSSAAIQGSPSFRASLESADRGTPKPGSPCGSRLLNACFSGRPRRRRAPAAGRCPPERHSTQAPGPARTSVASGRRWDPGREQPEHVAAEATADQPRPKRAGTEHALHRAIDDRRRDLEVVAQADVRRGQESRRAHACRPPPARRRTPPPARSRTGRAGRAGAAGPADGARSSSDASLRCCRPSMRGRSRRTPPGARCTRRRRERETRPNRP